MNTRSAKNKKPTMPTDGNGADSLDSTPDVPSDGITPPVSLESVGGPFKTVELNTAVLNSAGPIYQRPLDLWYVRKLIMEWSWEGFRTLYVNQRPDGTYWIVDGQHRVVAIREKFGDMVVGCYLSHVEGPKEEARIAKLVNDGHSAVSPATKFQWRLTMQEPEALAIERIAHEEGYALALHEKASSEFHLTIPAVLDGIYNKGGKDRLRSILRFAKNTWGGQPKFASSHIITSLSKFFEYYGSHPAFDETRITEVLSQFPVAQISKEGDIEKAEFGGHRHICCARAMQKLYNAKVTGGKKFHIFRVQEPKRPRTSRNGKE